MRLAPWAVVNRHQLKSWPMGPWALVFGFERRSSILAYTTLRFRRCVAVAGDNRSSDQLRRSSGEGDLVSSSQILAIFSLSTVRALRFCCRIFGFMGVLSCWDGCFLLSFHVCVTAGAIGLFSPDFVLDFDVSNCVVWRLNRCMIDRLVWLWVVVVLVECLAWW